MSHLKQRSAKRPDRVPPSSFSGSFARTSAAASSGSVIAAATSPRPRCALRLPPAPRVRGRALTGVTLGHAAQRPPSNFAFLKTAWPDLALEAMKAERNAAADPRGACFYARRALELAVHWLYDADRSLRRPYKDDLSAMVFEPSFQAAVEQRDPREDGLHPPAGQRGGPRPAADQGRGRARRGARAVPRHVLDRAHLRARPGGRAAREPRVRRWRRSRDR